MPKNVLDLNEILSAVDGPKGAFDSLLELGSSTVGQFFDVVTAFAGRNVSIKLISATNTDGTYQFLNYLIISSLYAYLQSFLIQVLKTRIKKTYML